ncbi:hypothetical protein KM043_012851 [Ampulex compressa]|nr:hypothetical protein KM043_012851 [Ampulex compressa]
MLTSGSAEAEASGAAVLDISLEGPDVPYARSAIPGLVRETGILEKGENSTPGSTSDESQGGENCPDESATVCAESADDGESNKNGSG